MLFRSGHHFSSIVGVGPIVGSITAAGMFGWLPAYLWCVIGFAFLGGPHDMGGLVSSMRHEGKSIGEVVERWIGRAGKILFLCFTILTLILVVAVFLQLSANSFASDPAVAFAATLYIFMALIFGLLIYRMNCPLWLMTIIMVPIIIYACWFGNGNKWISSYFSLSGNPTPHRHQGRCLGGQGSRAEGQAGQHGRHLILPQLQEFFLAELYIKFLLL